MGIPGPFFRILTNFGSCRSFFNPRNAVFALHLNAQMKASEGEVKDVNVTSAVDIQGELKDANVTSVVDIQGELKDANVTSVVTIPRAPKKPMAPYFRFLAERRPEVAKNNPDWKGKQVVSNVSQQWREADVSVKKIYQESYDEELIAYSKNFADYLQNLTAEQKEAINLLRLKKQKMNELRLRVANISKREKLKNFDENKLKAVDIPKKPKKPLSPFFRFLAEYRAEVAKNHPDLKSAAVVSDAAQKWRESENSLKNKYQEGYQEELNVYSKTFLDYSGKLTEEHKEAMEYFQLVKLKKKGRRDIRKKNKETNKPKRPANAYTYFVAERLKGSTGKINMQASITSIGTEWSNLSPEEKEKYNKKALEDKERYKIELDAWETKMMADENRDGAKASFLGVVKKESE